MPHILHIWSRLHCRWVRWHGTYAAWLRLPHAVALGCTAAVVITAVHLARPKPPALRSVPVAAPAMYLVGLPRAPQQWRPVPSATPPLIGASVPLVVAPRPSSAVSEPASLWLMLAGVAAMVPAMGKRQP
jgi:hypothetical protein